VPERKLNPLQQITYLAILNVLLPLQILTGALMWGADRWPRAAQMIGGLGYVAPVHTLLAWLFAAFLFMHIYLTTTGHTPTANIKAMVTGWEELNEETESKGNHHESGVERQEPSRA
jgi:thiosulfate reductase cytochrome b subunit